MQIFLVSIRTARIYGPGQLATLEQLGEHFMRLQVHWPFSELLDEWEGYAVVVPEKKQIWGACKPQQVEQMLHIESMMYTPQPIAPKELMLFAPQQPATGDAAETAAGETPD